MSHWTDYNKWGDTFLAVLTPILPEESVGERDREEESSQGQSNNSPR